MNMMKDGYWPKFGHLKPAETTTSSSMKVNERCLSPPPRPPASPEQQQQCKRYATLTKPTLITLNYSTCKCKSPRPQRQDSGVTADDIISCCPQPSSLMTDRVKFPWRPLASETIESNTNSLNSRIAIGGMGFSRYLERQLTTSNSTATPNGGPYSSTDIVSYSNDVGNRHISSEEFRHNNLADTDRDRDRRKSNGHERRPNSLNTSPKSLKTETKVTNIERPGREREQDWDNYRQSQQLEREFTKDKERTLNVDRIPLPDDRDDIKPSNSKVGLRPNYFKPLGARNNFITNRDPQIIATHQVNAHHQHTRSQSGPSREPEDLVAMGTIWNPNNVPVQKNGTNSKSFNTSNPTTTQINVNSLNPALTMSKKYPTSRMSQLTHNSGNNKKEADPRYSDPIIGAPASFQQRLAELAALESETVRWERNRKFKKKKQQDTS